MNSISNALSNFADDEIKKGDLDKAQENIQKAIELNHENPQLYNNSAFINLYKGDYQNALEDINNSLEKDPENTILKENKLEVLDKQENLTEESKNFLIENITNKNNDEGIQNKALNLTLKMVQNGKQELNEDTMEKLLDNMNFEDKNNNKIENKEEENDNINNE